MRVQTLMIALAFAGSVVLVDDFDESTAIKKIELLGGKVIKGDKLPGCPVIGVDFRESKRFNEKYLRLLKPFKNCLIGTDA